MHIGKRIKRYREAKGWSQSKMAEVLNLPNFQTLSRYEKKESLDLSMIKDFNKRLGVDLLREDFREDDMGDGDTVKEAIAVYATATTKEEVLQLKACVKTLMLHLAKVEASVTGKSAADCLTDMELDTKLHLTQLISGF